MATFLVDLKTYLTSKGFSNIYRDYMPDSPDETIGLFIWSHTVGTVNDGTGTRYVQIQARAKDGDTAYARLHQIAEHLDSGETEKQITLATGRWVIARPRSLPRLLKVDASNRTIYYFDVALFGANTP